MASSLVRRWKVHQLPVCPGCGLCLLLCHAPCAWLSQANRRQSPVQTDKMKSAFWMQRGTEHWPEPGVLGLVLLPTCFMTAECNQFVCLKISSSCKIVTAGCSLKQFENRKNITEKLQEECYRSIYKSVMLIWMGNTLLRLWANRNRKKHKATRKLEDVLKRSNCFLLF